MKAGETHRIALIPGLIIRCRWNYSSLFNSPTARYRTLMVLLMVNQIRIYLSKFDFRRLRPSAHNGQELACCMSFVLRPWIQLIIRAVTF